MLQASDSALIVMTWSNTTETVKQSGSQCSKDDRFGMKFKHSKHGISKQDPEALQPRGPSQVEATAPLFCT